MPGLSCASHSGSAPGSPRETFVTCRTAYASELPDVAWQSPRLAGGERLDGHSSVTSSSRTVLLGPFAADGPLHFDARRACQSGTNTTHFAR